MSHSLDAEVLVVGASLAGLACARTLAQGGASVRVFDDRPGLLSRNPGLALIGTSEAPERLLASLGARVFAELFAFSKHSVQLADPTGRVLRTERGGTVSEAMFQDALEKADLEGRVLGAHEVSELLGGGFGLACEVLGDGEVDVGALKKSLARDAARAGAQLHFNVAVSALELRGVARLDTSAGLAAAEIVVLANGWRAAALEPWLKDKLWPVRCEQRTASVSWPAPGVAVVAQQGHLWWAAGPDAGTRMGGARWASPHLEVGETVPCSKESVQEALQRAFDQRFAGGEGRPGTVRIETLSCDGLPLVGARPGGNRVVCCLGFGEHELSWGLAAGEGIARVLLGAEDVLPSLLRPARFML